MHVISKVFQNIFYQQICDGVTSQVGNVFGRRSNSIEVSMTGGCCHSDLCNHHKLTPLAMSTNPPPMTTIHTMATTTAKSKIQLLIPDSN